MGAGDVGEVGFSPWRRPPTPAPRRGATAAPGVARDFVPRAAKNRAIDCPLSLISGPTQTESLPNALPDPRSRSRRSPPRACPTPESPTKRPRWRESSFRLPSANVGRRAVVRRGAPWPICFPTRARAPVRSALSASPPGTRDSRGRLLRSPTISPPPSTGALRAGSGRPCPHRLTRVFPFVPAARRAFHTRAQTTPRLSAGRSRSTPRCVQVWEPSEPRAVGRPPLLLFASLDPDLCSFVKRFVPPRPPPLPPSCSSDRNALLGTSEWRVRNLSCAWGVGALRARWGCSLARADANRAETRPPTGRARAGKAHDGAATLFRALKRSLLLSPANVQRVCGRGRENAPRRSRHLLRPA